MGNTPIFIIILGGVIFAIALFGCCGAWQENKCLIYTYGTILFFILIAQVAAGIAAFALRGPLKTEITKNMEKGMENYNLEGFKGVTTTWDLVQNNLHLWSELLRRLEECDSIGRRSSRLLL